MGNDIQSLAVHLDGPHRAVERLTLARRLATEHGARISVLYATAPRMLILPGGQDVGGYVARAVLELEEQRRQGARAAFDSVLRQPGPVRAEFIELPPEDAVHGVARQAMVSDLLVLGQDDPDQAGTGGVPQDFPERVLAASGRAGLLVPYAGRVSGGFTTAVVAWKQTPECARALAAALPILRKAAHVYVVAWGADRPEADEQRLQVTGYLKLHGIDAQWEAGGPESGGLGDMLLSRTADLSADLLVMGCYGHSRAREWIRGGASRTVLRSMTLPVLMAH